MDRIQSIATSLPSDYFGESSLDSERARSGICPLELESLLFGEHNSCRREMFEFLLKNKNIFTHSHLEEEDRPETRLTSALKLKKLKQILTPQNLADPYRAALYNAGIYSYDMALSVKFVVHFFLYAKTLQYLGTERHLELKRKVVSFEHIGCFGLTELMHGSNVRGMITEAHYDHSTGEFVLNSGDDYGMKFWIGAASNLANVTCIWAQLFVDGKNHGLHAFVVQIRDLSTHTPNPGVTIGDCGPKMGLEGIDNGFIKLKNVRVPKKNLLNRFSDIDENGKFVSSIQNPDRRFGLQLGALSGGRVLISMSSLVNAEIALVIATRFAMLRKQFGPPGREVSIFQHPLTRARLIPLISQSVVMHLGSIDLHSRWFAAGMKIMDPNNSEVQFLHAISSVMKPMATWFASQAIDQSRQVMGGHGYSSFSKVPSLLNNNNIHRTWEGDNSVLLMQTQKFILDSAQKIAKGKPLHSSLQFLKTRKASTLDKLQDLQSLQALFESRLATQYDQSLAKIKDVMSKEASQEAAVAKLQAFCLAALSLNFGHLHYLRTAASKSAALKDPLKAALQDITKLYAYRVLRQQGFGCEEVKARINSLYFKYIELVRPHTARVLDALAPPADVIGSPFAYQDKAYERYLGRLASAKQAYSRVPWWGLIHE